MMDEWAQREHITAQAKQWLGTPYRHQSSMKGVGCDCLGLVRGLWREIYGAEPEAIGPYSLDWAETSGQEMMLAAAQRHFHVIDKLALGCLIIFRWRADLPAKHVGIYIGNDRFIHAYERTSVVTSALVPQWRKRIAGLFDFPKFSGV